MSVPPLLCLLYADRSLSPARLPTLQDPTLNNTVMNITFSDPRASSCGQSSADQNESATIIIYSVDASGKECLDLDEVFTHPNVTYAFPETSSPNQTFFNGMRYSVTTTSDWSPESFNYSQIFYTQRRYDLNQPQDNPSRYGLLTLRAYANKGCPGNALNVSDGLWYSWDCQNEAGRCDTVPFGVKSIQISGNSHVNQTRCHNAVKYNAGSAVATNWAMSFTLSMGVVVLLFL